MADETKRTMSEARKKANAKYESKAYDKILLRVESGKRNEIKAHAEKYQSEVGKIGTAGYIPKGSVNGFILKAIDEAIARDIERDNQPKPPQTETQTETPQTETTSKSFEGCFEKVFAARGSARATRSDNYGDKSFANPEYRKKFFEEAKALDKEMTAKRIAKNGG